MRPFIALLALLLVLNHPAHAAQRNLTVTASAAQEQKRVALVIGNAAYQGASVLRNPVNDARAMSNALNGLGFQVIEVTDASQKEMNRAITAFGSKLNAETVALFFYAGHGLQVKGRNYIIPVDAQIGTESAVASEAVSVDAVLEQLNASPISIVILDACRNNPFERSFRKMGGGGLAQMDAPKGSFIAYATAPGKTAADGDGKNGLFTQELLKQINTPGLSLEGVFKRVRANVSKTTGDAQMPWDSSSMTGDFYFKPGDGTQVASLVPVPSQQAARIKSKDEIEQDTWDSVRDSGSISSVQEYLKQYPKGRFVGQAKVLITSLKSAPSKPAEPIAAPVTTPGRADGENDLWTEAQKGNSKDDYDAYLAQYPKGKYVALAKSRIKKLDDEAANEANRKEQDAWEAADKTASEDSYRGYLKGWPSGKYTGLAQVRIKKLQTDLAARQEQELWQQAEKGETAQTVQAYLDKYPSGGHVAAALDKLAAIKKAEAEMKPGKVFRDCPDCPELVILPAGSFTMGSSKGGDESPAHSVTIRQPFAMGKTEVTQGQWKAVMGNNPSSFANCGDTCPVEKVSWDDAQQFIQKLNQKTGKQYRLPSEAEWEYACRAGGQNEYCGSDNLGSVGWYAENSGKTTHPAAQKQANAFGLYDMSGNVWEWVEDSWHGNYSGAPSDGTAWSGDGAKRVLRGGSGMLNPGYARSAYRYDITSGDRLFSSGFRVARMLP